LYVEELFCFFLQNHYLNSTELNLTVPYRSRTSTEQIGAVESVKAASDIYCPVSGVVENVNDKLGDAPNLLNKSPEKDGE